MVNGKPVAAIAPKAPVPATVPWRPDPWNAPGADIDQWNFSEEEKARLVHPDKPKEEVA